jgi:murein DD-endopeptidase MepM/ murein hydrolase activator NlpD
MGLGAVRRLGSLAAALVLAVLLALVASAVVAQEPTGAPVPVPTPGADDGGYRLPWPAGYSWEKYFGWHGTGYGLGYTGIDFAPPWDAPRSAYAVLAAGSGTLSEMCGPAEGDPWQSTLRIDHPDGLFTLYLHLDGTTVPRSLIGHWVQRGQFLGMLYTNQTGDSTQECLDGSCSFGTLCGSGTTTHLHFQFGNASTPVDGYVPQDIATSADGSEWLSHNVATGYDVPAPAAPTATAVPPPMATVVAAAPTGDAQPTAVAPAAISLERPAAAVMRLDADWPVDAPAAISATATAAIVTTEATPAPTPAGPAAPIVAMAPPTATPAAPATVAYVWEGSVSVPTDGTYLLMVSGSDDAELWLDGRLVAEGVAASTERTLSAGEHDLRVVCLLANGYASASFSYTYVGPARSS